MTEQQKEIETIKERNIVVKLSDADCKRISDLCGEHNLKVGELLENFIGDLVGGTYTNGSDERMYARQYFERCWFGMFPEKTLLNFLLSGWEFDLDRFMDLLEQLEDNRADLEEYEKNPEGHDWDLEEIEFLKTDIEDLENELAEIKQAFFKENEKADWEKEVENVKKFVEEREQLVNG